jgi:hypothetical protein
MRRIILGSSLLGLLLVAGCATIPTGPSVMSLPGSGKSFDQFRIDDADCRGYAYAQVGGATADRAATQSGVTSAALGTVVGAVAGAAIGGGRGAGIGAGSGLVVGSLAGTGAAQTSAYGSQRRYDHAYIQCMYAKGHRVPVYGQFTEGARPQSGSSAARIPPPPPGSPPPPPPDAVR